MFCGRQGSSHNILPSVSHISGRWCHSNTLPGPCPFLVMGSFSVFQILDGGLPCSTANELRDSSPPSSTAACEVHWARGLWDGPVNSQGDAYMAGQYDASRIHGNL